MEQKQNWQTQFFLYENSGDENSPISKIKNGVNPWWWQQELFEIFCEKNNLQQIFLENPAFPKNNWKKNPAIKKLVAEFSKLCAAKIAERDKIKSSDAKKILNYFCKKYQIEENEKNQILKKMKNSSIENFVGNFLKFELKKLGIFLPIDAMNELGYEIIYGAPEKGFGSHHFGLTPEKFAEMCGISLQNLAEKKVALLGAGAADFAIFSLPENFQNLIGVDISANAKNLAEKNFPTGKFLTGNVSKKENVPDAEIFVLDYFLDVTENPMKILKNVRDKLPSGGKIVINILLPISQSGFESKKDGDENLAVAVDDSQDIGNTGDPFSDAQKLLAQCEKIGLRGEKFAITSYAQFDARRDTFEMRPSGILVLEKNN